METQSDAQDPREAGQIAYWNDNTAANWTALQARIDPVLAPITALALREAAPRQGNPWKAKIAELQKAGVTFELCTYTAYNNGWVNADLLPVVARRKG